MEDNIKKKIAMVSTRARVLWSWILVAAASMATGCAKQYPSPPPHHMAERTSGAEAATEPAPQDTDLVGVWRGYWSPSKGSVETERYLFLRDGRWGWLATTSKTISCLKGGVAQRSGRWSLQGRQLVLEELQRKELAGCKDSRPQVDPADPKPATVDPSADGEPALQEIRHTNGSVETLAIGQCPPNQEAKQQDISYACLSIGGKAFWRHPKREAVNQALFLGDK